MPLFELNFSLKIEQELPKFGCVGFEPKPSLNVFLVTVFRQWSLLVVLLSVDFYLTWHRVQTIEMFIDSLFYISHRMISQKNKNKRDSQVCECLNSKLKKSSFFRIVSFLTEFSVFARGQEECRQKWLSAQVMCANLQKQLDETRSNEGRLELQIRHVTELLKQEIQIRQRLQKDEKDLVGTDFIRVAAKMRWRGGPPRTRLKFGTSLVQL